MADTILSIKSGLPFAKKINITLPSGRSWWTEVSDFEILMQIREKKDRNSPLVMDLADFLTITQVSDDVFSVDLAMTGADTRLLTRGGFYDMIMSDIGVTDERGLVIIQGPVKRTTVITAEVEDEP